MRILVALVPIAGSLLFVVVASRLVHPPSDTLLAYLAWWLCLCVASTIVLVAIEKVARRLMPLSTLLGLSLVFPDQAPSRFKVALRSGTVNRLRDVVDDARRGEVGETPAEAAERVLELVAALNAHDRLTRGHSERVRAYTKMIGEELGIEGPDLDLLHWAGLLHDIGKLEVPYEILNSTGRPTDEEWEILKRHPAAGAAMIAPLVGWLGEWSLAVGQHHERWDGAGYPDGLAGTDISLAARIVSVADVFDVITSARSYKKPTDAKEARAELARCAGTQFDPVVVRAFLNISLGRLRLAMGPLSLLAQSPFGAVTIPPIIGAAATGLALGAASIAGGLVSGPPATPAAAAPTRTVAAAPAPVAPTVRVAIDEDTPTTVALDGLPTDGLQRIRVVSASGGAAAPGFGASLRVTPPENFAGELRFGYEACRSGECADGTLIVTVRPVDDPPGAVDDSVTIDEGSVALVDVVANDADVEHDRLRLASVGRPGAGQVEIVGGKLRYAAPADFSGTTQLSYDVTDGAGGTGTGALTVHVRPVDHGPMARADAVVVTQGQTTVIDALANDSDPDGDVLSLTAAGSPSVGRARQVGELIVYTPPGGASGPDSLSYTVTDPSGRTASADVSITIVAVNDPPAFTAGADQSVAEDAGPQVVPGWVSGISAGPVDEAGQSVAFTVADDDPSLFAVAPAVAPDGSLSYTPAANASGAATVTVRATDTGGGTDTSPPQSFTITVVPVNDAPSFVPGVAQSVAEDSGARVVAGWASGIGAGPVDEAVQSVSFVVSDDNAGLFAVAPSVAANGTLSFTPAADANGVATVTVVAHDDGGTTGGGADSSATRSFTITVVPVNDAPAFTAGAAQSVAEDSGARVVAGWAGGISAGPADEAGQSVSFVVSDDNAGLFAVAPAVAADGTLSFTPAADANGAATVTVVAHDDGGTAGGGVDSSAPQTFTITVTPVNDAPGFTAGADASVSEDAGAQSVAGWAGGITAGPADEAGQSVSFVVSDDNAPLFAAAPAVAADGTLSYTPALHATGSATVTVVALDDGGTAGGGANTSAPQTFTITAVPVPPSPQADAYTVDQDTTLTVPAPGLLANDFDALGIPLTVSTVAVTAPTHGVLALAPDGAFVYTPTAGFIGGDAFTYRVDDGFGLDATADVAITVDSGVTTSGLYLGTSGASADDYDLTAAPPPAATPVTDVDADGDPGLTIQHSGGSETENQPRKYQLWSTTASTPIALDGPVALDLWSSIKDFRTDKEGDLHVYLYDCAPGGGACVKLAQAERRLKPWNTGSTWTEHTIVVGSVTHTIPAGNVLRVRLVEEHEDLWVAMTAAYPSHLDLTRANTAPVAGPDAVTVLEDTAVTNLAVLANDADANIAPSSVTITALPTKGSATAVGDGTIDYTPAPDANGTDTLTYRVCDTGGLCTTATVTITITAVNDAPAFVGGADQSTLEDSGTQTVAAWAGGIGTGPPDESGQGVSFSVTSDNPSLFAAGPSIAADGTLAYRPAANQNGSATVTVRLVDVGGTANGGVDTSPPQTFTVTVVPVNDAPSFTMGSSTSALGGIPVSNAAWATAILAGPADESGQGLAFTVTNDNPGLFIAQPAIGPDGRLTFTGSLFPGSATVTVTLSDDGGVANGGTDTSASQTFSILII